MFFIAVPKIEKNIKLIKELFKSRNIIKPTTYN